MKYIILINIFFLWSGISYSQKEDYNWIFGTYGRDEWWAGINTFQFTDTSLIIKRYADIKYGHFTAVSTISDKDGNLLLSTNGMEIRNNNLDTVVGGNRINYNLFWESFHFVSNTFDVTVGLNLPQGTLLLKWQEKDSIICITSNRLFIDGIQDYCKGLFLNIVDISDDKYKVVKKDDVFFTDSLSDGTIQACRHANGRDWWIVVPGYNHNKFFVFLLDPSGIKLHHTELADRYYEHAVGQAYFSPDGTKYALIDVPDRIAILDQGHLSILDFDRVTGTLSNLRKEDFKGLTNAVGCAISYDSRFLFTGNATDLHQYDLKATDILGSKRLIAKSDGFKSVFGPNATKENDFGFFQLAPDGKIYGPGGLTLHMHRIEYPDEEGEASQVTQHAIQTSDNNNTTTNLPNYRLGPLDGSPADTLGIDNHPIAKFRYEQDTTNHLNVRFTDLSYFRPETWHWDFGDGTTFEGRKPYWHEFPKNGTYNVCLTVSNENSENTMCRLVTIGSSSTYNYEPITNNYISVFPNPTEGEVLLTISDYIPEHGVVYFYDMMGRVVYKQRVYYGWNNVDLSNLTAGNYIYVCKDNTSTSSVLVGEGKIVKL